MAFSINTALNFFRPAVNKQTEGVETAVRTGAQILKEPPVTTVKHSKAIDTVDFSKPHEANLAKEQLQNTYGGLESAIAHLVEATE